MWTSYSASWVPAGPQGDVLEAIRAQHESEPCVKEFPGFRLASDRRLDARIVGARA